MTTLLVDGNKDCSSCGETKPLEEFHRSDLGLGGRQSRCKVCTNRERREYRARHPEHHRQQDRDRYNGPKKRVMRDRFLRRVYGVTLDRFEEMIEEQDGGCAICGRTPDPEAKGNSGSLHMDHDHLTGIPRRPLCHDCNNGLGRFLDDPDLLEAAAIYIRSFR